jgi:dephospho-CoA kinase
MVETIRRKVQERVNNSHAEIVTALLNRLVLSHNSWCGCEYCQILEVYVSKKITLQRLIKSDDIDEYRNSCSYKYSQGIADAIYQLRSEIRSLKTQKDEIKEKFILYNLLRYD